MPLLLFFRFPTENFTDVTNKVRQGSMIAKVFVVVIRSKNRRIAPTSKVYTFHIISISVPNFKNNYYHNGLKVLKKCHKLSTALHLQLKAYRLSCE